MPAAALAVCLGVWAVRFRLGYQPGGNSYAENALPIALALVVVASAVCCWWRRIGLGLLVGFIAATLVAAWPMTRVGYVVLLAVLLAVPLGVAAATGPSRESGSGGVDRRTALIRVGGYGLAVIAGGAFGRAVYRVFWGPTHPASETESLPRSVTRWAWSGAMSATGFVVKLLPERATATGRLVVDTDPGFSAPRVIDAELGTGAVLSFRVDGLDPRTSYHYAYELEGVRDPIRTGRARTFPAGRAPVRLAFGSCARSGSNGAVFDRIREADPDAYVCLGDFHYGDVRVDRDDEHRRMFDDQLLQPAQAALYRSVPFAYVWDDHDFGPNDTNIDAPGRPSAMRVFREYVPHYDLAGPESAVFQAFTIGRVRVVLTDTRSSRDPQDRNDGPGKSMLGAEQLAWFETELVDAAATHDVVIWGNPVPWIGPAEAGDDSWPGYDHERRRLASLISDHAIDNLVMVSGDAHMVAIDDGSNTAYASGDGFPLLHVAALDRPGSITGGPFSHGAIAGGGHFGMIEITPTDDRVEVALSARNWDGAVLLDYGFELPQR